jgi:hypothetical protein
MPPRYAYWTILVDDQPTAFRAGSQDDLMPTFKRLKLKHASAKMMWWQNGKLWDSRLDAQEAMQARGEMGRRGDARQGAGFRNSQSERPKGRRTSGREPRGNRAGSPRTDQPAERRNASGKLEWQPKGVAPSTSDRKPRFEKPEWKPRGDAPSRDRKPRFEKPDWKPKGARTNTGPQSAGRSFKGHPNERTERTKLEWTPKSETTTPAPKRKWIPKEEFKRSGGIEARRDKNWRPGGEHKDPRQKYKDAKKAKWGRFKQTIRKRWESKQGTKKNGK